MHILSFLTLKEKSKTSTSSSERCQGGKRRASRKKEGKFLELTREKEGTKFKQEETFPVRKGEAPLSETRGGRKVPGKGGGGGTPRGEEALDFLIRPLQGCTGFEEGGATDTFRSASTKKKRRLPHLRRGRKTERGELVPRLRRGGPRFRESIWFRKEGARFREKKKRVVPQRGRSQCRKIKKKKNAVVVGAQPENLGE